jgi:hypothetical protein
LPDTHPAKICAKKIYTNADDVPVLRPVSVTARRSGLSIRGLGVISSNTKVRETLNKSTFYGEPARLCDAGSSKINGLPK